MAERGRRTMSRSDQELEVALVGTSLALYEFQYKLQLRDQLSKPAQKDRRYRSTLKPLILSA
jgi:hypothetical protein